MDSSKTGIIRKYINHTMKWSKPGMSAEKTPVGGSCDEDEG
jgi:hypothetical protein